MTILNSAPSVRLLTESCPCIFLPIYALGHVQADAGPFPFLLGSEVGIEYFVDDLRIDAAGVVPYRDHGALLVIADPLPLPRIGHYSEPGALILRE